MEKDSEQNLAVFFCSSPLYKIVINKENLYNNDGTILTYKGFRDAFIKEK